MQNEIRGREGKAVRVVDEVGREHVGLVTRDWNPGNDNAALNVVFITSDADKTDPYGLQVERLSSLSPKATAGTPGRYWEDL